MSLRDILLFGILAYLVPKILAHPYIGALAWVVFGVMSPHRLTWGPAYNFQFSMIIAVLTLFGLTITREHRMVKGGAPGVALIAFTLWFTFANFFPFHPVEAWAYWQQVMKVFLMTGVLLLLLHTPRHVELLVWMLVVSLGFYGIKGGIFTILTGGQHMVNGPDGSVMEGNNALGVGLVIVIPLMIHLYRHSSYSSHKWVRWGLASAAALCAVSVLGTYSRGALLAVFAMGCLLWYRSSHKLPLAIAAVFFTLIAIPAMPDGWTKRMHTIETYEEDTSALQRLAAWQTAINIAKDKFPVAGGFEWASQQTANRYSPSPQWVSVAHSIYFQVIGSQGFIGVVFFLIFWWLVWRQCGWIRRKSRDHPDLRWAFSLASMTQVSMAGYAVGGAFLDLAFWDLPYYLYAAVGTTRYIVRQELAVRARGSAAGPTPRQVVRGATRSYPVG